MNGRHSGINRTVLKTHPQKRSFWRTGGVSDETVNATTRQADRSGPGAPRLVDWWSCVRSCGRVVGLSAEFHDPIRFPFEVA